MRSIRAQHILQSIVNNQHEILRRNISLFSSKNNFCISWSLILLPSCFRLPLFFFLRPCQSPIETERVRKVIIYFYLEDDSIHIAEARSENSGLPQVQYWAQIFVWGADFFVIVSDIVSVPHYFVSCILAYILDLSIP